MHKVYLNKASASEEAIKIWINENISKYMGYDVILSNPPQIAYYFSDLETATLFRLKF